METERPSRWPLIAVLVFALALHLPSLGIGFYADDYVHQLALDGKLPSETIGPLSLFDFGTAEQWRAATESGGVLPWWAEEDWKVRFLRPLSSLTMAVDHALFGRAAWLHHLHGFGWYVLVLLALFGLFADLGLRRRTSLLALLIFASTNGSVLPVGWLANRNALIAGFFLVLAVRAVVRASAAKQPIAPRAVALSLLAGALACAGKESGVVAFALCALWLAIAARRAESGEARRTAMLGASAHVVAAFAYLLLLFGLGYGTRCVFYATPWDTPLRYGANVVTLLGAGTLRLVAPISLDMGHYLPGLHVAATVVGFVVVLLLAGPLRKAKRPATGFLAAWIPLAFLPEGAAFPSDRLLFVAAMASAPLLAIFVGTMVDVGSSRWRRIAGLVVLVHATLFAAGQALVASIAMLVMSTTLRDIALSTDVGPEPPPGQRLEVVLLQAGDGMTAFTLAPTWAVETGREDARFHLFQTARNGLRWFRESERVCVFESLDAPFLTHLFESVYLSGRPIEVGARFEGTVFDVEVLAIDGGGVRRARLEFARSLDDPRLRFLVDSSGVLAPIPPPAVGATIDIPTAPRAHPFAF